MANPNRLDVSDFPQDWVVRDAVCSEPVSACYSLVTGKNREFVAKTGRQMPFRVIPVIFCIAEPIG